MTVAQPVAVANQRVAIPVEDRRLREAGDYRWVPLRELLQNHLGDDRGVSDEEVVALALMGREPIIRLEPLGGIDGVARTFRVLGARDIEPHLEVDEREEMNREKVAFMWSIPNQGIMLRFPRGARFWTPRSVVNYEDFQE